VGDWFDTSLNWGYPPDPGPWRQEECDRFNAASLNAFDRLRTELGPDWDIVPNFADLREDPDLDRCLADPAGFQRGSTSTPTASTQ
jgi:hypothetical protein